MYTRISWRVFVFVACSYSLLHLFSAQPVHLDIFDYKEMNNAVLKEMDMSLDHGENQADIEEAIFYMEEVLAIGNLTEECSTQYQRYTDALGERKPWALLMQDSTGKPEAGRVDGNYYYEGDFQECDAVLERNTSYPSPVKGLYCTTLWYRLTPFMTRGRGLCLPNTCTDQDALVIAEIENYLRFATENLTTDSYCAREKDVWADPAAVASIVIVALFVVIVLVSSICDHLIERQRKYHDKKGAKREFWYLVKIKHPSPKDNNLKSDIDHVASSQGIDNKAVTSEKDVDNEDGIEDLPYDNSETQKPPDSTPQQGSLTSDLTQHTTTSVQSDVSKEKDIKGRQKHAAFENLEVPGDQEDDTTQSTALSGTDDDGKLFSEPPVEDSKRQVYKMEVEESAAPKVKPSLLERCIQSFSLYKTVPQVLNARHPKNSFQSLNAIRFLSMSWVVLGHSWTTGYYYTNVPVIRNRFVYYDYAGRMTQYVVNNVSLAVEAFFILTALLATTSFLRRVKKQSGRVTAKQMIRYYVHRYWRLTPVYMLLLMVYANTFMYWGRGPFFRPHWVDTDRCKEIWWKNMLYVNNLFSPQDGECMLQSWYLANDFQLYCMAPAFFFVFIWNKYAGVLFAVLGYMGSTVANVVINYQLIYGAKEREYYYDVYIRPWTHSQTFFLGILLGYILSEIKSKLQINKVVVLLGWLTALVFSFIAVYGQYFSSITCTGPFCGSWTQAGTVTFLSLYRPLIGCSIFWTIFACVTGNGGLINTIFSWKGWIPLARLSYVAYLFHPMLMFFLAFSRPVQFYVWDWIMVYIYSGTLTLTLAASFIITLIFEVPFMRLEGIFLPQ